MPRIGKNFWGRMYVTNFKIIDRSDFNFPVYCIVNMNPSQTFFRCYCGVAFSNNEHTAAANVHFVYLMSEVDEGIQGSLKHHLS